MCLQESAFALLAEGEGVREEAPVVPETVSVPGGMISPKPIGLIDTPSPVQHVSGFTRAIVSLHVCVCA